jgi:hypothetical protein
VAWIIEIIAILALVANPFADPSISLSVFWVIGGAIFIGIVCAIHISIFRGILNKGIVLKIILPVILGIWCIWVLSEAIDVMARQIGVHYFDTMIDPIFYDGILTASMLFNALINVYSLSLSYYPAYTISVLVHVLGTILAVVIAIISCFPNKIVRFASMLVLGVGIVSVTILSPINEHFTNSNALVRVPNLIGMTLDEATDTADALGLNIDFRATFGGTVIETYPASNELVEAGTTIWADFDMSLLFSAPPQLTPNISAYGREITEAFLRENLVLLTEGTEEYDLWINSDHFASTSPMGFELYDIDADGIPEIILVYFYPNPNFHSMHRYINGEFRRVEIDVGNSFLSFFVDSFGDLNMVYLRHFIDEYGWHWAMWNGDELILTLDETVHHYLSYFDIEIDFMFPGLGTPPVFWRVPRLTELEASIWDSIR